MWSWGWGLGRGFRGGRGWLFDGFNIVIFVSYSFSRTMGMEMEMVGISMVFLMMVVPWVTRSTGVEMGGRAS